MKKKLFLFFLPVLLLTTAELSSQCTFTTAITVSGATTGCGSRTLTAANAGDIWTPKNNFGGGSRQSAAAFSIGNKGYIATGYDCNSGISRSDLWEYDATTDTWTQKAAFLGTARYDAVGFSVGTKGYVCTGFDGAYKADLYEYDPAGNSWTSKMAFPGIARRRAVGFGIGTKGYFGMGYDNTLSYCSDFWQYDPSGDTWTQLTALPGVGRSKAVAFVINSKGYVGSGENAAGNPTDFYEFDPSTGTWTSKASLGAMLTGAVGYGIGNFGYVSQGYNPGNYSNSNLQWCFDPIQDTWNQTANTGSFSTNMAAAFVVGSKAYIVGGLGNACISTVMDYEPKAGYLWSNGATTQTILADGSSTYSVLVTSAVGCTARASQFFALSPNPTINVVAANAFCDGVSNTLTANGATTYTWSANAGGGNSGSVVITPSLGSTYSLSGTTGSCTVNYLASLLVYASPVSTIAVSGPTAGCGTRTLSTTSGGNTWAQKANISIGRYGAVGFSIGNKGYICAGFASAGFTSFNDLWEYDPAGNAWTQKANLPGVGRYSPVAFSIGSKGYVGTGYDGISNYFNDFYQYDPSTNGWTQKASFIGPGRYGAACFSVGTKAYVGTGVSPNVYYNDFYEYDAVADVWTQKNTVMGLGRFEAVGFSIGSKGYFGTGVSGGTYLDDFYEYDPVTDGWTSKANYGGGVIGSGIGFSIGTKGYIGTGNKSSGGLYTAAFWEYDPVPDKWTQKANFGGTGRNEAIGFSIGGKGYLGSGNNPGDSPTDESDFWEYEPDAITNWSTGATDKTITVSASGSYTVNVTNTSGCFMTAVQSVSLSPNPTITLSGFDLVCGNGSSTLSASGAGTYTWSANAGSANSNSVVVTPTTTTIYTVSGTTGTCSISKTATLDVIAVTVPSIITIGSPTICGAAITLSSNIDVGDTWTQKASFNSGRSYAVAFSIGNKGYFGTGVNGGFFDDFWEYNPANNSWTQKVNFPGGARAGAVGFSIGNKGYVGTGENNTYYSDFWAYDPSLNTWSAKSGFPGTGRYLAVGFSIGTKGYIGTGQDISNVYYSDFYEYDSTTDTWTQKASMTQAHSNAIGFSIGNKGYIGTGNTSQGIQDFLEYDPVTNVWTHKAVMGSSSSVYGASAFVAEGHGFVCGGVNANEVWQYTPATNTWLQKGTFTGGARRSGSAFSIANKGYYCGGDNSGNYYSDLWEYNTASTIQWSTGASTASVSATSSGIYTLSLTNLFGCTTSGSQTLSITNTPTISFVGPDNLCIGGSLALSVTGAMNYTWSPNAGNPTTNSIVISPTNNVSYSITGETNSCVSTASTTITVNPLPVVTASTSSSSVCQGFDITLMGNGAQSYAWSGGANDNTPFAPSSTMEYTVTGTDNNACKNTAVISVTVLPSPTIAVNSGSICVGESFTMNPSGGITYSFSNGTSVVSPTTTQSYTVTGYNNIGCSNAVPAISTVSVDAIPVIAVSDATLCMGSSYTLDPVGAATYTYSGGAAVVSPASNATYTIIGASPLGCISANTAAIAITVVPLPTLSVSNGTICNGQSFTISPTGASTYTYSDGNAVVIPTITTSYTISGASAQGCSGQDAVSTVSVQSSLTLSISGPTTACSTGSIALTAQGADTYSWSNGATGSLVVVNPPFSTSYSVSGLSAYCTSSNTHTLHVIPGPIVNTTAFNAVICSGDTTGLNASGADTYSWSTGAVGSTAFVSPEITTDYTVTGTNTNGCSASAAVTQSVSDCLGIENAGQQPSSISVYPNPGSGAITVVFGTQLNDCRLELYNYAGQLIMTKQAGSLATDLDFTAVSDGMYLLHILSGNKIISVNKLIKQ